MKILRPGTVVGVVALALVAGTATALVNGRPTSQSLATREIAPSPEIAPDAPEQPDAPSPAPAPSPAGTVAPTAGPTASPTATGAPQAPALPRTTGSPAPSSAAPAAQTGNWKHTQNGVTLTLVMRPARPWAGELVTFTVDMVRPGNADCCATQVLYGDNMAASKEEDRWCRATRDDEPSGRATYELHHAYRRAGTYTPWVHVMAGCGRSPHFFTFKPTFRVADGPLLSNGPMLPWVDVFDSVGDESEGQWFLGGIDEHDGYPLEWSWSWGDGTESPVTRNPDACHWPKDGGWIESSAGPMAAHRFPATGTYTITLTAVTSGCDGKDRQVVSRSIQWTVHPGSPGAPPES